MLETQVVSDRYALYNDDCVSLMQSLPDASIHLSVYSPPFSGLYNYSSNERDLSNNSDYGEFFEHYGFVVSELARLTMPGRMTAVHAMDIPDNSAGGSLRDFPGDILRLHERTGWVYVARYAVWKEPLTVRNRTMAKGLAHKTIVEDSTQCSNAAADYLLVFRRKGDNPVPIAHPTGFHTYAGRRPIPDELHGYKGWTGKQTENRFSHWIWRQYASAFWDDIRLERVLPYRESKDSEDEKHVHPLQLDVIERIVQLWSNPDDIVFSPFGGVGSEPFGAVECGRRAIAVELKASYYRQMVKNMQLVGQPEQVRMFDAPPLDEVLDAPELSIPTAEAV